MDELGTEVRRGERGVRDFKENRKGWRWSEERRICPLEKEWLREGGGREHLETGEEGTAKKREQDIGMGQTHGLII